MSQADGSKILILEYRNIKIGYQTDRETGKQTELDFYYYYSGPLLFIKVKKDGTFSSLQKLDKAGFVMTLERTLRRPYYSSYHLEKIDDDYFITYLDYRWVKQKYKMQPFLCIKKLKQNGEVDTQEIPLFIKKTKEKGFRLQIANGLSLGDKSILFPTRNNRSGTSLIQIQLLK